MFVNATRRRVGTFWLMSELSVRQHARADGHRTPALPREEALSHTELSILGRFNDRRGSLDRERDGALHTHRLGVIEASFPEHTRAFPAIVTATKVAIHKKHLKFNLPWQQALDHIHCCDAERKKFKNDNLLTRDADNPDPMLAIGIGALAFVSETALNGLLFARVFEGGLAEGTLTAATLAAPNIGLGLIAGFWGLRACHDNIRPAVRRLGATVTGLSLSTAAAWNLYIGQIRALAEHRAAASQPFLPADWRTAATNMLTDPLAPFQSGPALTLVLVGLVVVGVALREGLDGFSDRYPGFSRVDRRYHRAVARAETLKWRFFRELDYLTRRGIRAINRNHRAVHAELREAVRILGRAAGVIIRFDERLADQLWVHREAISAYRAINRRARDEVDVPTRFDQQPLSDTADTLPVFDWLAMDRRMQAGSQSACNAAQSAIADLERYRLDIMQEVERQLAAVTNQKVLLPPVLLPAPEYA